MCFLSRWSAWCQVCLPRKIKQFKQRGVVQHVKYSEWFCHQTVGSCGVFAVTVLRPLKGRGKGKLHTCASGEGGCSKLLIVTLEKYQSFLNSSLTTGMWWEVFFCTLIVLICFILFLVWFIKFSDLMKYELVSLCSAFTALQVSWCICSKPQEYFFCQFLTDAKMSCFVFWNFKTPLFLQSSLFFF